MKRGKCLENRKVNRVKLFHFISTDAEAPSAYFILQSAAPAFLTIFCALDMLQGEVVQPPQPLGLQPGQPLISQKRDDEVPHT